MADILTALSGLHSLAVVSRTASFAYKGRSRHSRAIALALGATYLRKGSVRRAGDRLRLTAQPVKDSDGTTLWTDRFACNTADIADVQDRVTETVASLVAPAIDAAELARSRQKRPESLATYDQFLRARALMELKTKADSARAHFCFTQALAADPENPQVLVQAALSLIQRTVTGFAPISPDDLAQTGDSARRALHHANGGCAGDGACRQPTDAVEIRL